MPSTAWLPPTCLRSWQGPAFFGSASVRSLKVEIQWGDCSFAVAAPRLWNKLPADIRTTTDLGLFKSKLKTHFFRMAFNLWLGQSCALFCLFYFMYFWKAFNNLQHCGTFHSQNQCFKCCFSVLFYGFVVKHFGYLLVIVKSYINTIWLIDCECVNKGIGTVCLIRRSLIEKCYVTSNLVSGWLRKHILFCWTCIH